MGQVLLWVSFLLVLAAIGVTVRTLVRELRRQLQTRQPAPEPVPAEVAPARMTLTAKERPQGPAVVPPAQRTGHGLAYLLPSPQSSTA